MMRIDTLIQSFPDLESAELTHWVERHWVMPDLDESETWIFTDVDVARVRLIYDLRRDMDVAEDMVPLVLSLLDQVYDLRCTLKTIDRAIAAQPAPVKAAILDALRGSPAER